MIYLSQAIYFKRMDFPGRNVFICFFNLIFKLKRSKCLLVSEGIHLKLFTSSVKGSYKLKVEPGLPSF